MLIVTVSGPQAQRAKALKVLKEGGTTVTLTALGDPLDHDWGHQDNAETEVFLTVEHDDVDRVVEVLEPLHWRLRSHRERPEPIPAPSVEERLASIGLSLGDLRTALGA